VDIDFHSLANLLLKRVRVELQPVITVLTPGY
jgi:hypothetical protein